MSPGRQRKSLSINRAFRGPFGMTYGWRIYNTWRVAWFKHILGLKRMLIPKGMPITWEAPGTTVWEYLFNEAFAEEASAEDKKEKERK